MFQSIKPEASTSSRRKVSWFSQIVVFLQISLVAGMVACSAGAMGTFAFVNCPCFGGQYIVPEPTEAAKVPVEAVQDDAPSPAPEQK